MSVIGVFHRCGCACGQAVVNEHFLGQQRGEGSNLVTDLERVWTACADALRQQVSEATWRTWFQGVVPLDLDTSRLLLAVPNHMALDRLQTQYAELLEKTVADTIGGSYAVTLEVHPGLDPRPTGMSEVLSAAVDDLDDDEDEAPGHLSNNGAPPPPPDSDLTISSDQGLSVPRFRVLETF